MLKLEDRINNINLECESDYAVILNEKDGIRFLSNVPNGKRLVSVIGSFLCGAVTASIKFGLSHQESKTLFLGILNQIFNELEFVEERRDKSNDIEEVKKP